MIHLDLLEFVTYTLQIHFRGTQWTWSWIGDSSSVLWIWIWTDWIGLDWIGVEVEETSHQVLPPVCAPPSSTPNNG